LVVDEPLANRVRSGRKQPQRARHGSSCQPPTFDDIHSLVDPPCPRVINAAISGPRYWLATAGRARLHTSVRGADRRQNLPAPQLHVDCTHRDPL